MIIAAMLAMTTTVAIADEVDDAHRLAVSGRDDYWNCLAREYPRDGNKAMSEQDFTSLIAKRVCLGATEFSSLAGRFPQPSISNR